MTLLHVGLAAELNAYADKHGPVTVGLAGSGQMGTDMVVQLGLMPGVRLGALSELNIAGAEAALKMAGSDFSRASSAAEIDRAIESGRVALTEDYKALCAAPISRAPPARPRSTAPSRAAASR
ncbi:hypothetical protein [Aureimonas sp. Leaf427]|uniref:hypothetical protein n=1 Tax=Aureimonas sp. Leaf427 TaxID=1736375 RepID=UPI00070C3FC2|nr:hypothetical protein [Aureimonas sp. Leaf427]KQT57722.1 hypothetical protein ASG62_24775 [Aureimonas sp. Leaf427]